VKYAALQEAIYDQLNNSSVTGLLSTAYSPLVAIFTDVPQAADSNSESFFPFITIGADIVNRYDTKDALGGSVLVQVDVWARATSMLGIKAIADAVDARLRRQALTISGAIHVETLLESATQLRDPDGKTKRMLMLYRVIYFEDAETPVPGGDYTADMTTITADSTLITADAA
jgi:hypothetical protein